MLVLFVSMDLLEPDREAYAHVSSCRECAVLWLLTVIVCMWLHNVVNVRLTVLTSSRRVRWQTMKRQSPTSGGEVSRATKY